MIKKRIIKIIKQAIKHIENCNILKFRKPLHCCLQDIYYYSMFPVANSEMYTAMCPFSVTNGFIHLQFLIREGLNRDCRKRVN